MWGLPLCANVSQTRAVENSLMFVDKDQTNRVQGVYLRIGKNLYDLMSLVKAQHNCSRGQDMNNDGPGTSYSLSIGKYSH